MASITVKTDDDLKREFGYFCEEMGLNVSVAINMFMKAVLREGRIPFELRTREPNYETLLAMQETEDIIAGRIKRPTYKNVEELFDALDKED